MSRCHASLAIRGLIRTLGSRSLCAADHARRRHVHRCPAAVRDSRASSTANVASGSRGSHSRLSVRAATASASRARGRPSGQERARQFVDGSALRCAHGLGPAPDGVITRACSAARASTVPPCGQPGPRRARQLAPSSAGWPICSRRTDFARSTRSRWQRNAVASTVQRLRLCAARIPAPTPTSDTHHRMQRDASDRRSGPTSGRPCTGAAHPGSTRRVPDLETRARDGRSSLRRHARHGCARRAVALAPLRAEAKQLTVGMSRTILPAGSDHSRARGWSGSRAPVPGCQCFTGRKSWLAKPGASAAGNGRAGFSCAERMAGSHVLGARGIRHACSLAGGTAAVS